MQSKIILVQNKLKSLGMGFDSIFADGANDIIVKPPSTNKELKIKVLARSGPKPAGGTGAAALDWWIPENIAADAVTLVDLEKERCWLFKKSEIFRYAQQHPPGKYHFFMYVNRSVNILKNRLCFVHEFDDFLIENNFKSVFG